MGSHGLEAFCLEASYIAAFNILNLPSLALPESSLSLSSNLSWLASSNVTIYTDDRASILANFEYEEIVSLPLSKPLAIQCPVPACIFPISGYFTSLQRLLLYINCQHRDRYLRPSRSPITRRIPDMAHNFLVQRTVYVYSNHSNYEGPDDI